MEEDVEIEFLLKSNEDMLMLEAFKMGDSEIEVAQNVSGSAEISNQSMGRKIEEANYSTGLSNEQLSTVAMPFDNKEDVIDSDMIQEIIDDEIVSCMALSHKEQNKHVLQSYSDEEDERTDDESDEANKFINEIVSQNDQYGGKLMEQVKNIIGKPNKNSQTQYPVLSELVSACRLISERDELLKNLERKFQEKLYQVEENIQQVRETLMTMSAHNSGSKIKEPSFTKTFFKKFGMPYFKDSYGFGPSGNVDHASKLKADLTPLMLIEQPVYWTKSHQNKLLDAIKETLVNEKAEKLIKKLDKFKAILSGCEEKNNCEELQIKLAKTQQELEEIKIKPFSDLISDENVNRDYDWMKYSASVFDGEHSPEECKQFWEVYLKPSVNKSNWICTEDMRLLKIAEQLNFQDWNSITDILGTNRSAYQCFVHFQTRLNAFHDHTKGRWTKKEDEKLMNVINASRIGNFIPWPKVACHMGSRNLIQIYNRFNNCLNPKLIKGKFTKNEDLLIVAGIEVFGCNYKEIASLMNNRSIGQIRDRYERYLIPKTTNVGSWTLHEDEQLMKLVEKYGEQNWAEIAKVMKIRSRTQVRQRYRFIQQKMESTPGWNITDIKRRNIHVLNKNLELTKKSVAKIKTEIEQIEESFNLNKIETDTFRIEKLKELRDKIQLQNYKFKRKSKINTDHVKVNSSLEEFFRLNQLKPLNCTKISNHNAYQDYFNELIFLARNFGHELEIPDNQEEILNNPRLDVNLKNVLLASIEMKTVNSSIQQTAPETFSNDNNIDYIPPESDESTIMNKWWFTPPMDISRLNFSELFKPTIFDYSYGIHKDIWKSKMKQSAEQTNFSYSESYRQKPHSIYLEEFNLPPNQLTIVGYKSVLLSKSRLKQDAKRRPKPRSLLNQTEYNNTTSVQDINNCLHRFQDTMFTLFTWPKNLSLLDISSTYEESTNSKKMSNLQMNIINVNGSKIVEYSERPSLPNDKGSKKYKKGKVKQYNVQQGELNISREVRSSRKMKIENLLTTKGETATHPAISQSKMLLSNNEYKSPIIKFKPRRHRLLKNIDKMCFNNTGPYGKGPGYLGLSSTSAFSNLSETENLSLKLISKTYVRPQKRRTDSESVCVPRKKMCESTNEVIQSDQSGVEYCLAIQECPLSC